MHILKTLENLKLGTDCTNVVNRTNEPSTNAMYEQIEQTDIYEIF